MAQYLALFLCTGLVLGTTSALSMGIATLPFLVDASAALTGTSAALAGLGFYLDPFAVLLIRGGSVVVEHTDSIQLK